jgi:hypothetical protein
VAGSWRIRTLEGCSAASRPGSLRRSGSRSWRAATSPTPTGAERSPSSS